MGVEKLFFKQKESELERPITIEDIQAALPTSVIDDIGTLYRRLSEAVLRYDESFLSDTSPNIQPNLILQFIENIEPENETERLTEIRDLVFNLKGILDTIYFNKNDKSSGAYEQSILDSLTDYLLQLAGGPDKLIDLLIDTNSSSTSGQWIYVFAIIFQHTNKLPEPNVLDFFLTDLTGSFSADKVYDAVSGDFSGYPDSKIQLKLIYRYLHQNPNCIAANRFVRSLSLTHEFAKLNPEKALDLLSKLPFECHFKDYLIAESQTRLGNTEHANETLVVSPTVESLTVPKAFYHSDIQERLMSKAEIRLKEMLLSQLDPQTLAFEVEFLHDLKRNGPVSSQEMRAKLTEQLRTKAADEIRDIYQNQDLDKDQKKEMARKVMQRNKMFLVCLADIIKEADQQLSRKFTIDIKNEFEEWLDGQKTRLGEVLQNILLSAESLFKNKQLFTLFHQSILERVEGMYLANAVYEEFQAIHDPEKRHDFVVNFVKNLPSQNGKDWNLDGIAFKDAMFEFADGELRLRVNKEDINILDDRGIIGLSATHQQDFKFSIYCEDDNHSDSTIRHEHTHNLNHQLLYVNSEFGSNMEAYRSMQDEICAYISDGTEQAELIGILSTSDAYNYENIAWYTNQLGFDSSDSAKTKRIRFLKEVVPYAYRIAEIYQNGVQLLAITPMRDWKYLSS